MPAELAPGLSDVPLEIEAELDRKTMTVAELLAFACEKAIRMVSPELAESREGLKAVIPPDIAESW